MAIMVTQTTPISPPQTFTFSQLKNRVLSALTNKTALEANVNLIGDFIVSGYQTIARLTHSCKAKVAVTIPKGSNDLELTGYELLFVSNFHLTDSDGGYHPLDPITYGDYLKQMKRTREEMTPRYFAVSPTKWLFIHPIPGAAYSGTFEIAFVPEKLVHPDDEIILPHGDVLYHWAVVEMKRILGEPYASYMNERDRLLADLMRNYRKYPNYVIP